VEGLRPEALIARTQTLENEIRMAKQRHDETLQKFKSSCKVWKDGTKKLAMTSNPIQDVMAARLDGVAAAAKDAESAVSLAMTQPSHSDEIEEINREVLLESGIPHARIRKIQRVRPVGKHIEYQPAKKNVTAPPRPSIVQTTIKNVVPLIAEDSPVEPEVDMEYELADEDGHANEAFEAMEAMEFDVSADFDYDSENHAAMDMGVD
jgi:hypothetical protein